MQHFSKTRRTRIASNARCSGSHTSKATNTRRLRACLKSKRKACACYCFARAINLLASLRKKVSMRDTMNYSLCEREKTILRGVSENRFDADALSHIETCASCREAIRIARCLHMLATESASETPALPAAGLVRWKAQLIERQLAAARATQSISITQIIAPAVVVITLLGCFMWRWHLIAARWAGLKNEWQQFLTPTTFLLAIPLSLAVCFLLISLATIFTLRTLLKNDFKKGIHQNAPH